MIIEIKFLRYLELNTFNWKVKTTILKIFKRFNKILKRLNLLQHNPNLSIKINLQNHQQSCNPII